MSEARAVCHKGVGRFCMKQCSKRKKVNALFTKGALDARVNPDTCGQSNPMRADNGIFESARKNIRTHMEGA